MRNISNLLGEIQLIFLFYGGGWLCAVVFTFFSVRTRKISRIVIWSLLSIACLFAQRSCWVVASGLATIGNGGRRLDKNDFIPLLDFPIVANGILFITLILIAFNRRRNPKNNWEKGYEKARKSNIHKNSGD